nr:hypothetical protein [uncultured Methanoregula sp.]
MTNNALAPLLQTVVPPLIFCRIAALSFLIQVLDAPLVALRYSITTSMFFSAVMYYFSQLALIPGLGMLTLFDKFMISMYLFLAVTIMVTTICYLAQHPWNCPELVRPINRIGLIVSLVLPLAAFWLIVKRV